MARYALSDVDLQAISLVKVGANRKRFFLRKSDGAVIDPAAAAKLQPDTLEPLMELSAHSRVVKADDWSAVYTVVAEPGWAEGQGVGDVTGVSDEDVWVDADEIRKAAHQFMRNGALINHMHESLAPFGTVVENCVAPVDFAVDGEVIKAGSWYIAIEPSPSGRELIEKGELGGVSIQGTAVRTLMKAAKGNDLARKCPTCNSAAPAGATTCPNGHKLGPIKKATISTAVAPGALLPGQQGYGGRRRRRQVDEPDALLKLAATARPMDLLKVGTMFHERTIGSKGNDLWGIKGAQLPAYIQHLYNDLVQAGHPTGSETYRLAVGEVENWAEGHDGHGNKVSADTQAKATAAIAEWNKLRAQAHADNVKKGSTMHKLIAAVAKAVGIDPDAPEFSEVEKAQLTFAQIIGRSELSDELPCAMDALREAIYDAFYPFTASGDGPTPAEIRAALEQSLAEFADHMLGLYDGLDSGTIKKSGEEIAAQVATLAPNDQSEEDIDMDESKIADLMKSAVEAGMKPLGERLDAVEARLAKADEDKAPTATELTATVEKLESELKKTRSDIAKLASGDSTVDGGDDDDGDTTTAGAIAHVRKNFDPQFAGVLLA